ASQEPPARTRQSHGPPGRRPDAAPSAAQGRAETRLPLQQRKTVPRLRPVRRGGEDPHVEGPEGLLRPLPQPARRRGHKRPRSPPRGRSPAPPKSL
ncbi:MAG: hypothetical protein AVDCRST_MAG05-1665, partial [uncultured Rubrobacteraceae bacterium]